MINITWKSVFKKIGILYLSFSVFSLTFFFMLRSYTANKYSEAGMENALSTVSNLRDITGDPCLFSILGDPIDTGPNYAKVNIYCPGGKHSNNSVDLRAFIGKEVIDLLKEVGRINGFEVSQKDKLVQLGNLKNIDTVNSWNCHTDTRRITDFTDPVQLSSTIDCYYAMNDNQIEIYRNEKH